MAQILVFHFYSHFIHLPNLSITSMVSTTFEIQCTPVYVSFISPKICKKNFHYLPFLQYCQYLHYFHYFQYFQYYCTISHFLFVHLHIRHFYLSSNPIFCHSITSLITFKAYTFSISVTSHSLWVFVLFSISYTHFQVTFFITLFSVALFVALSVDLLFSFTILLSYFTFYYSITSHICYLLTTVTFSNCYINYFFKYSIIPII